MKLLFDENLSDRLVVLLKDLYPGSVHVRDCGLKTAPDRDIWEYARGNALTVVTRDSDFRDRSLLRGFPPKVIWLPVENCSTAYVEFLIRASTALIGIFDEQDEEGCLVLGQARQGR